MKYLFSPEGKEALRRAVESGALLAFDFDGTLAPIVARPGAAAMRATTRRLLAHLCRLRACAVITGRSRADAARRLRGCALRRLVGNHGMDHGRGASRYVAAARAILSCLEQAPSAVRGVWIENKDYSLSVHYKHAPAVLAVRPALRAALRRGGVRARILPGKRIINILPAGAPGKGDALLRVARELRARSFLFIGDDATDEEAFTARRRMRGVTVRVGRSAESAAEFYLRSQSEIDALLRFITAAAGG